MDWLSNIIKLLVFLLQTNAMNNPVLTNPPSLFNPLPYGFSHLGTVPAGYNLVFVAGQGGEEDTNGKLTEDFRKQVHHSLKNVQSALASCDLSMDDVIKVTTLVVDHDESKLNIIIDEFKEMWPQQNFPVNTLIPVPKLAIEGMMIEIDAIAIAKSAKH